MHITCMIVPGSLGADAQHGMILVRLILIYPPLFTPPEDPERELILLCDDEPLGGSFQNVTSN
jgi:hypothetical protein